MSSLDKALAIVSLYATDRVTLTVSEVASDLSMPKSSVSRLMRSMADAGLLEPQAGGRGYMPGVLAFRLGNLYQTQLRIMDLVDEATVELVEKYGLTGYIGVRRGTDVVLLSVRQGRFPIRLVLERGTRVPAHVSAIGQALLSRLSDDTIQALYPVPLRYRETGVTHTPDEIVECVRRVRALGHAALEGVTFHGFNAVSAAVESPIEGTCVGFSLSYPRELLARFDLVELIEAITASAARIGAKTGDSYWTDRSVPAEGARDAEGTASAASAAQPSITVQPNPTAKTPSHSYQLGGT